MPNVQLVLIMLLLAVAVVAAYFYLKRAQQRTDVTQSGGRPLSASPVEPPAATPSAGATSATAASMETDRRDE